MVFVHLFTSKLQTTCTVYEDVAVCLLSCVGRRSCVNSWTVLSARSVHTAGQDTNSADLPKGARLRKSVENTENDGTYTAACHLDAWGLTINPWRLLVIDAVRSWTACALSEGLTKVGDASAVPYHRGKVRHSVHTLHSTHGCYNYIKLQLQSAVLPFYQKDVLLHAYYSFQSQSSLFIQIHTMQHAAVISLIDMFCCRH